MVGHRGLQLVKESIVSMERLNRSMLVVRRIDAFVERGQRNADPVAMETDGQNVAQHDHERQACHERSKAKPDVWGNVFFPKGWGRLRKSPAGKKGDGGKGWKKHNQAQAGTNNLPVNGMDNGFGEVESETVLFGRRFLNNPVSHRRVFISHGW